ncbi:hypothetical protein [Epilithonimonas sp. UC225_85]|uniref:hypothetical protein n=1 Tax=Epilithonimonas sp. UC225_85 TaxID=3350167 RepID=UPI0036D41791
MNFDDKFTKEFEEKFQKNLKGIRSMTPEEHQKIKESLEVIYEFAYNLKNKPDKSPEELEMLAGITIKLEKLSQTFRDMQLILGESLYRQSLAFYEHVKKLAKEGNKEAEIVYNDLKIHVEKFDPN